MPMTLRLPDDDDDRLRAVARVDGVSVAEAVREAIRAHIDQRRNNPEFRARLKRIMEEEREVLERLAR